MKNGIWEMENEPIYTHVLNNGGRPICHFPFAIYHLSLIKRREIR
jgi:hypothetical protein